MLEQADFFTACSGGLAAIECALSKVRLEYWHIIAIVPTFFDWRSQVNYNDGLSVADLVH